MSNLQTLKDLGVRTLTVKDHFATAVNPHTPLNELPVGVPAYNWVKFNRLNLPPLPTSGIPDGTVSIEEVEEEKQKLVYSDWVPTKHDFADKKSQYRTALVKKQVKEEEPKAEFVLTPKWNWDLDMDFKKLRKDNGYTLREVEKLTWISNAYLTQLETGKIKKPSYDTVMKLKDLYSRTYPIEAQEQTAEGIEPKAWVVWRDHKDNAKLDGYSFVQGYVTADSQLAQYKAKLIVDLQRKKELYVKFGRLAESTGVEQVIDLIQNS